MSGPWPGIFSAWCPGRTGLGAAYRHPYLDRRYGPGSGFGDGRSGYYRRDYPIDPAAPCRAALHPRAISDLSVHCHRIVWPVRRLRLRRPAPARISQALYAPCDDQCCFSCLFAHDRADPGAAPGGDRGDNLSDMFLAVLAIHDLRSSGRIHPATLLGGTLTLLCGPLRFMIARSSWWEDMAGSLVA